MKWSDWKHNWGNKQMRSSSIKSEPVSVSSDKFFHLFGDYSGGKQRVRTPESAMAVDTVYRCVDILSGTIASLPIFLRRKKGEIYAVDEESPLNDIFRGEANERQNFFTLMQNAVISILFQGNAYIYPKRNAKGDVDSLILLSSGSVSYDVNRNVYIINDATNKVFRTLEAYEIIHLKNKSLDGGYTGVSTITYASRTLSIGASADEQTLEELGRGNKMRGFVSGGAPVSGMGSLQDSVVDDVAERIESELSKDKAIIRLPGAVQFSPISISPVDAQLLETRKFSPFSICRFFGVHPDMVFVEQSSNYKASENSQITFLNQTLNPILTQIENEFSVKLISPSPKVRRKQKVEYDRTKLQSMDLKAHSEYIKTSVESGTLTPNEARQILDREPIQGGDTLFISCNLAPVDSEKIRGGEFGGKNDTPDDISKG